MTLGEPEVVKKTPQVADKLSDEDETLKTQIEAKVEIVLTTTDASILFETLSSLLSDVRTVSGGMTTVPKPLRFLRPHYQTLADRHERFANENVSSLAAHQLKCADILAVLATVISSASVLKWRLAGSGESLSLFGTEFARGLTIELPDALIAAREAGDLAQVQLLEKQVDEIVAFYSRSNAEIEAVDLLAEVEMLEKLIPLVDDHNIDRVVLYLASTATISAGDARDQCLCTAFEICLLNQRFPAALRLALRFADERVSVEAGKRVVGAARKLENSAQVRQLALILAHHGEQWKTLEIFAGAEEAGLAQNERLAGDFRRVMTELEASEAKTPEDVFKTHLEERSVGSALTGGGPVQLDSAKQNLASSIVNAFVNCASGADKLLLPEGSNWLYKNKDMGLFATAASIGLLYLWDLDEGLAALDKYQWSNDVYVKAGALMGFGLVSGGRVNNDCDPALALLADHLSGDAPPSLEGEPSADQSTAGLTRLGAALGLGFAYAGSRREEVRELLTLPLLDGELPLETSALTAVALALVFVGSGDAEIAAVIVQAFTDRLVSTAGSSGSLGAGPGTLGVMYVAALGVLVVAGGSAALARVSAVVAEGALPADVAALLDVVLEGFAAAGSGDVLVVQKMLQVIAGAISAEPAASAPTGTPTAVGWRSLTGVFALLGVGLSALGEKIGEDMSQRLLEHVHQFGGSSEAGGLVKRTIPLVVALLNLSDAKPQVVETLGKFAHDADVQVGLSGVVSLGLVGFGTNNARIAGILRQQASFFAKDANMLFAVRLAQGFLHAGKGLVALRTSHSDEFLTNPVAMAGLTVLLTWLLAVVSVGPGAGVASHPYMWLLLSLALKPRMLVTVHADTLEPVSVAVRVGQSLDVVGQAGKQVKTITGFQTHTTPVLLAAGERAELANAEDWVVLTPVLEGVVLVREQTASQ